MQSAGSLDSLMAAILLLVASALFTFASLVEGAIGALSRARVQRFAERDESAAKRIVDFAERPTAHLTTTAVIKLASLLAAALAVWALVAGGRLSSTSLFAWILLMIGALVLGWIVPRVAAVCWPERIALRLAVPFRIVEWIFAPLVRPVAAATSVLARLVGAGEAPEGPIVTSDELKVMVAASEEEGLIEQGERTMIDNILELEDITVREIMVPRPDIVAVPATATIREAVDTFVREGYSRLPVYRETIDDVAGILYSKDLFPLVAAGRLTESVGAIARSAYFVPESKKTDDLLRELQQKRVHIAIVVDEYGGTAGLVTIEDLLEEIVGEIQDEFDTEEQKIIFEGDGQAVVDGSATIDDVNDALALNLEADEVDTIGGLVYEKLGRVPVVGDTVDVEQAKLTVVAANGRRVSRVRVVRIAQPLSNGTPDHAE